MALPAWAGGRTAQGECREPLDSVLTGRCQRVGNRWCSTALADEALPRQWPFRTGDALDRTNEHASLRQRVSSANPPVHRPGGWSGRWLAEERAGSPMRNAAARGRRPVGHPVAFELISVANGTATHDRRGDSHAGGNWLATIVGPDSVKEVKQRDSSRFAVRSS